MSTAFVQYPAIHSAFRIARQQACYRLLLAITCIAFGFSPTHLEARDLFAPSEETKIIRKALVVNLLPVKKTIPDIVIDLKYATSHNFTGRSLYPSYMPCLLHRMTLNRLKRAQKTLRKQGLSLKIWDAYRPPETQMELWNSSKASNYVVSPKSGPSLHSYGVAVDVTLVDRKGQTLIMPTPHDEFSAAAASNYTGNNPVIRYNLDILQKAMKKAGFSTIKDEWWHFTNMEPQSAKVIHAHQLGIQLPNASSASKKP